MKSLPKILLALCAATLGVGIYVSVSKAQFSPVWTVVLPLGAILYGLCLISFMLRKETARFDEEERRKTALTARGPIPNAAADQRTVEAAPAPHDLEPKHAH